MRTVSGGSARGRVDRPAPPEGRVYVCTGATALKVGRIRRDPRVRLARCTARGRPTGPTMLGRARILAQVGDESAAAERAIQANHGLLRRFYSSTLDKGQPLIHIEIGPA